MIDDLVWLQGKTYSNKTFLDSVSHLYCSCCRELLKEINPFPLTTNLQQMTLKTYPKKIGNWMELKTWWQKEKFLVLSNFFFSLHVFKKFTCFQKAVFCRGFRKHLHKGKGQRRSILSQIQQNCSRWLWKNLG